MSEHFRDDYETRRAQGKRMADGLRARYLQQGDELGWFEACYEAAGGDAAKVPWGHLCARIELTDWLKTLPADALRGRALDVGCGLGDNAAALARAGFKVTAIDISPTAINWAQKRFADFDIAWRVVDLLDPPVELHEGFDLVNETYTLQALRADHRALALNSLAGFVAPGGSLLIICRGLREDEQASPPPWPLKRSELEAVSGAGLNMAQFEELDVARHGRAVLHFRAIFKKTSGEQENEPAWR